MELSAIRQSRSCSVERLPIALTPKEPTNGNCMRMSIACVMHKEIFRRLLVGLSGSEQHYSVQVSCQLLIVCAREVLRAPLKKSFVEKDLKPLHHISECRFKIEEQPRLCNLARTVQRTKPPTS
eukprot:4732440-Amphidinium_carterae.1